MSPTLTMKNRRTIAIVGMAVAAIVILLLFVIFSNRGGSVPDLSPEPEPGAQQLYVSPTGADGNDGSQGAPLRTIQAALDEVEAGGVINLAPGEYREQLTTQRDGEPGAPITIRGPENGKDPSGRNQAVLSGTGRIVNIDHSYYTLEGFTIDGQERLTAQQLPTDLGAVDAFKNGVQSQVEDSKLIYIGSADTARDITGVTIRNMFLTEAGTECVRLRNNANGNTIADSVIQYCGLRAGSSDDDDDRFPYHNGEGVYIGTSPSSESQPMADNDTSSNNVVTGNVIRTFGSECLDVKENAHDNVFENNECSGNTEPREFNGSNVELRGHSNIVRGNVIADSAGWNVKIQSDDDEYDVGGNSLQNNTLSGAAAEPVRIGTDSPQGAFCGNRVTAAEPVDGTSPGDITAPCP
jgi:Right handed beta helix region